MPRMDAASEHMKDTCVARLQLGDAAEYRRLMLHAYELAPDGFTSTVEERGLEPASFWTRRVADPDGLIAAFGAFEGADLIGTVALELSARRKLRHKARVIAMFVAASARGKGVGRALLHAAIQHARVSAGVRVLTLTVTEGNVAAIKLYRAAGFEVFGIEPMAIQTSSGFQTKLHLWRPVADA